MFKTSLLKLEIQNYKFLIKAQSKEYVCGLTESTTWLVFPGFETCFHFGCNLMLITALRKAPAPGQWCSSLLTSAILLEPYLGGKKEQVIWFYVLLLCLENLGAGDMQKKRKHWILSWHLLVLGSAIPSFFSDKICFRTFCSILEQIAIVIAIWKYCYSFWTNTFYMQINPPHQHHVKPFLLLSTGILPVLLSSFNGSVPKKEDDPPVHSQLSSQRSPGAYVCA